ncbi:MAG: EamA family transporter [Candidatus Nanosalina sp.]
MELGILIALASAFTSSLRESIRKHVSRDFSSVEIGFMTQVYGVILLAPFAGWYILNSSIVFTPPLVFSILISALGVLSSTYIYVEAMRISDLSVTEPLRQMTPLIVALLEPLVLGTSFSWIILVAALLGAIGSYVLVSKNGLLKPLENMRNKGALMAVAVAGIFAVLAIAKRFGSMNIEPLLFTYFTYILGLAGFWIWKKSNGDEIKRESWLRKDVFAMGTVTAAGAVITIYAFSLISASEVVVVKQTSGIFGIIIGGRFFREERLLRKLIGAGIIIAGVALVTLL